MRRSTPTPPESDPGDPQRYFDTVTVSATANPTTVKETPGTVSVIDDEAIARRMMENTADLVTYEPGVYVEANLTRIGLNGFNIRGIGGNRVMTQIDGVETSEQFDFGPFNVHQFALDLDTLKSAEIVRSAGSSLYGSDALGGVVSFFTKDPSDYLGADQFHVGAKAMFDGRSANGSGNTVVAGGRGRLQGSAFLGYNAGHEPRNKGTVETEGPTRTALNPQDREGVEGLAKVTFGAGSGNLLRAAFEANDNEIDTEAYSSRGLVVAGPTITNVADIDSVDTMDRWRGSADQLIVDWAGLNTLSWNLYAQQSDTGQVVDEVRTSSGTGPPTTINRSGTLDYTQDTYGGAAQARKAFAPGGHALLVTFGGNAKRDAFDMVRDRLDINAATGAVVPPVGVILPSKYFPKSTVDTIAGYAQGEMKLGRLTVVPGLRYDSYSMDADDNDAIYIATQSPPAADFSADRLSARLGAAVSLNDQVTLHGQYAGGFRAPPYSAINSGFTNLPGRLHLDPEHRPAPRDQRQHRAGGARRGRPGQLRHRRVLELLRRLHPAGGQGCQPVDRPARVPVPERVRGRNPRSRVPRRGPARRLVPAARRLRLHQGRRRHRGPAAQYHRAQPGRDRAAIHGRSLGQRVRGPRGAEPVAGDGRPGTLCARRLRRRRPHRLGDVAGRPDPARRRAQPDRHQVLRVGECSRTRCHRPGDRPLLEPWHQRPGVAGLRLVSPGTIRAR